jgi:hypothetical protein
MVEVNTGVPLQLWLSGPHNAKTTVPVVTGWLFTVTLAAALSGKPNGGGSVVVVGGNAVRVTEAFAALTVADAEAGSASSAHAIRMDAAVHNRLPVPSNTCRR